ncbi:hypothetical protein LSH36_306g03000 [Paralvinella palmiformis]|uniref:Probable U3 small nucleolar RNA-associated protein 11 n=1 Tax=Paralvinella palmiformis TaxID=53620 RepID=A0AAD9JH76_9ANNE|nr:hypothetical protein LSH36_306g03000 [Paralvinella palmiformis]
MSTRRPEVGWESGSFCRLECGTPAFSDGHVLSSRKHLGFLEKRKDYKERAEDYHKKQKRLKLLKRRAHDRNPDEFYFNMVNTKLVDGVHTQEEAPPQYTDDQLKLMASQDIRYVNYKLSTETKKVEKLRGSLHLIDVPDKPKNKRIIFCDSKKEGSNPSGIWKTEKHYFDDDPELLRIAIDMISDWQISGSCLFLRILIDECTKCGHLATAGHIDGTNSENRFSKNVPQLRIILFVLQFVLNPKHSMSPDIRVKIQRLLSTAVMWPEVDC